MSQMRAYRWPRPLAASDEIDWFDPVKLIPFMHLESVAIIVEDHDAAIAFFVDVLGFDLIEDTPVSMNDGVRQSAAVGDQAAGSPSDGPDSGVDVQEHPVALIERAEVACGQRALGEAESGEQPNRSLVVRVDRRPDLGATGQV